MPEKECLECEYWQICHGGCPHDRLIGWHKEECAAWTTIWKHVEMRLSEHGLKRGMLAHATQETVEEILEKRCR